jgi:hypothetical protein
METRASMFSTAEKRSTLLENKVIEFAKEDDNSPRTQILKKECTTLYHDFHDVK